MDKAVTAMETRLSKRSIVQPQKRWIDDFQKTETGPNSTRWYIMECRSG